MRRIFVLFRLGPRTLPKRVWRWLGTCRSASFADGVGAEGSAYAAVDGRSRGGDGGVFTFGDATFRGSTGSLVLREPITGITTTPTGKGYRLVARDGGVFTFGDATFRGSLPGRHIFVNDVVGMATTRSSAGYWMARSGGAIYAFGDAFHFPPLLPLPIFARDPLVAIFSNPRTQGFRLVTLSGATVPFGGASSGTTPTGHRDQCTPANPPTMSLDEFQSIANGMTYDQVLNLVGGPGKLISLNGQYGGYAIYRWDGEGASGAYADVYFADQLVYNKAQHGLG